MTKPINLGVLASGRGTNLQAIIDATAKATISAKVAVVISDRSKAQALDRARSAGIPAVFVSKKNAGSQEAFDLQISEVLESYGVELVCLAGFMRILGPWFIDRYYGRMINIHPALLPSFPGLDAQRQALDYGVKVSGCTVHFADHGVDSGPIILQRTVPVLEGDSVQSLSERILAEEHQAFLEAIHLYSEGRLTIRGNKVHVAR